MRFARLLAFAVLAQINLTGAHAATAPQPNAAATSAAAPTASTVPPMLKKPDAKPEEQPEEPLPPGARVEIVADEKTGRATKKIILPTATEKQIDTVNEPAALAQLAKQFEVKQDWRHQAYALQRLYAMRPMQGPIGYELASAYARMGDKRKTYDLLVRLQGSGFGFDPSKDARFEKVHGTRVWDYLVLNLQANMKPFGGGANGFTLPAGDTLIESIAYDPKRKQFLTASVRDGEIRLVDDKGVSTAFINSAGSDKLLATYAVAVDSDRDALWVIGNGVPHRKGLPASDFGRAMLYKFVLSTGAFVAKYETPVAHRPTLLSSIAVSPKGDVFVADGVARRIYRLEASGLQMVIENPRLTSIRGMTFNTDGSKLIFADYDLGLFGIDLKLGKPFAIAPSPGFTLYGIEGVSWWNGFLVVVQNGFPPARVMRLTLDAEVTKVVHAQALDAARPEFGTPTQGVPVGDGFYFIANSQRGGYDRYGLPRDESKLAAVKVYRSDLKFAIDSGKQEVKPPIVELPPR